MRKRVLSVIAAVPIMILGADTEMASAATAAVQGKDGFVDVNGDGRADWCQGGDKLTCAVASGEPPDKFVWGMYLLEPVDSGYEAGRAWADFNGDKRADYCRVVGDWHKNIQCTAAGDAGFAGTFTSGSVDAGYNAGRAWADFDGDGRADYCRVVGKWDKRVQCTVSNRDFAGFAGTFTSPVLDPGYDAGRAWTDVNGDGRADYCRVVGLTRKSVQCTLSMGTDFGLTFTWEVRDPGWDDTRRWADFNGDGRADYCRMVGSATILCNVLPIGTGFSPTFAFSDKNVQGPSIQWADFNGDGRADYCRVAIRNFEDPDVAKCTLSNGDGFGMTVEHKAKGLDPVFNRLAWADFNGDGRADLCRTSPGFWAPTCTLSTGTDFGATISEVVGKP
jgi:hypothetical protein